MSLQRELMATGEVRPDDHPRIGFINFAPHRRVMSILVWRDRPVPADEVPTDQERIRLHKSMVSFAGSYRVRHDEIVFHLESSWNQSWTGHDHVRLFALDGNRLTLRTEPHPSATDGQDSVYIQVWEKVDHVAEQG